MHRFTITLSLALGLVASLVLAAGIAAKPVDPPGGSPIVAIEPESCLSTSASATTVPGGVYRAMVDELRKAGYSRAEIRAEIGTARVVAGSGSALGGSERCSRQP
jgi:hypothetical protein